MLIKISPNNDFFLFPFAILDLIKNKTINFNDGWLLALIFNFTDEDGICRKSNEFFAEQIGLARNTISNKLSKLAKSDLIRVVVKKDENNKVIGREIILKI